MLKKKKNGLREGRRKNFQVWVKEKEDPKTESTKQI